MTDIGHNRKPILFLIALALFSCKTNFAQRETSLSTEAPTAAGNVSSSQAGGGIADEIRLDTEHGTPSRLFRAMETIRSRNLASTEYGRTMINVNAVLSKTLYPALRGSFPPLDPPVAHIYTRILREAERGVYVSPRRNSFDYLEHVLPFLSVIVRGNDLPSRDSGYQTSQVSENREVNYDQVMADLQKAVMLNSDSVLAPYFIGIVYQHTGRLDDAYAQFLPLWEKTPDCYPIALSLAQVMEAQRKFQEAESFLSNLIIDFPDNIQVKRQLALSYYESGNWSRAEPAVSEILQHNSRDGEFILMRAHIFIEQAQLLQAQAPLDQYAGINPNNRFYLFLRARVQNELYNNRDSALNYLRAILRSSASTDELYTEAAIYAAKILLDSTWQQDQTEGRTLLARLLSIPNPPLEIASLALYDAIQREQWSQAQQHLTRLLNERRYAQDLLAAYTVESQQGNFTEAFSYARELYERDHSDREGIITYISALIDTGRTDEAVRMIEGRIDVMPAGVLKSRLFFLRSKTRTSEASMMNDLRSSLFENPRNLDALIAMFEYYHNRNEQTRAVYYLRQALALAPNNPRLLLYDADYNSFD